MSIKILCDVRCFDLARHFLQDSKHTEQDVADLAGEIQETVERYMNAFEKAAAKPIAEPHPDIAHDGEAGN